MINDQKIIESKDVIDNNYPSLSKSIYHKANMQKKLVFNKKYLLLILPLILALIIIPLVIDNNSQIPSTSKWNDIDYFSMKKLKLADAIINVNKTSNKEFNEELKEDINNANIEQNITSIMLLNNKTQEEWFSKNIVIIEEIIELVSVSYRQIKLSSEEVQKYIDLFSNGYTITCEFQNIYSIDLIILDTGEIVITDYGFCVSAQVIDQERFKKIVDQIVEEDDSFENEPSGVIDFNNIDVSNYNVLNIEGYSELDRQDYSIANRKYYLNYRVNIRFEYPQNVLVMNKLYNKMYIPGTNICFNSQKEYVEYFINNLGFDQFANYEYNGLEVSFDIGDLTKEKELLLLKSFAVTKYIRKIKISDNHYYESTTPTNYIKTIGSVNKGYLLIDSRQQLLDLYNLYEYSVSDINILDKYDDSFFKNKFLYCTTLKGNKKYLESLEIDITQKQNEVEYREILVGPQYGDETGTMILFVEIERVENYTIYDYVINGKKIDLTEKTIIVKHAKGEVSFNMYVGQVVDSKVLRKHNIVDHIVGLSWDNKFLELFESIIVENNMTLYALTTFDEESDAIGRVDNANVFVINVTNPDKNKYVTFLRFDVFNEEILEEKLGFEIEQAYTDYTLSKEYYFKNSNIISIEEIIYVTEGESTKKRVSFNRQLETITYTTKTTSYNNNVVLNHVFNNTYKNEVYHSYSSFQKAFYSFTDRQYESLTFDENTLGLRITRSAYNYTMINAQYELKNIIIDGNNIVVSLQRTYPEYLLLHSGSVFCLDFIELNNLQNIIGDIKNKNVNIAIDDTYLKTDFYGNMQLQDMELAVFDPNVFYNNISYKEGNRWLSITEEYERNQNKFIFKKGVFQGTTEHNISYGFLDNNKIDREYFNKLLGDNFDYEHNWVVVIDRYKNFNAEYVSGYDVWISTQSIYIDMCRTNYRYSSVDQLTRYVDLVIIPKEQISYLVNIGKFDVKISENYFQGIRTCTFTNNGNKYGVNALLESYTSDYQLNDLETYEVVVKPAPRTLIRDLIGYYPAEQHISGFYSSIPWLYIERTAKTSQINATYEFVSYDHKNSILTLKRVYNKPISNDPTIQVCYDLVEISGYGLPDNYQTPENFQVVIIEEYAK